MRIVGVGLIALPCRSHLACLIHDALQVIPLLLDVLHLALPLRPALSDLHQALIALLECSLAILGFLVERDLARGIGRRERADAHALRITHAIADIADIAHALDLHIIDPVQRLLGARDSVIASQSHGSHADNGDHRHDDQLHDDFYVVEILHKNTPLHVWFIT